MRKNLKNNVKRVISTFLSITILAATFTTALLPVTDIPVHAVSDKTISGLCTGAIANPIEPNGEGDTDGWTGCYVYYGKYSDNAMKYRVLDKNTTVFNSESDNTAGRKTMLLDCDSTLINTAHGPNPIPGEYTYSWADSYINTWLNGNDFYNNGNVFTPQEKATIAGSTKSEKKEEDGSGYADVLGFASLGGEHIFLLDAVEATRNSYGYANTYLKDANRDKSGSTTYWWLRSPGSINQYNAGAVYNTNDTDIGWIIGANANHAYSVSPAFNVNLASVIFSSVIPNTTNEYKLTVKDTNMTIAKTGGSDVTREGNVVTVPYTITGSSATNATQVSVLLTNTPYSAGIAAASGYSYQKLNVETWGTSGTGTFTLPDAYADKTCGTDYFAYILAEDVNASTATDYASVPVSITIPAAPTTYTITMSNDGHGTASASPASGATNTPVTITATPAINYHFKQWEVVNGGVTLSSTTTNPATFVIGTANVEIKAIFEHAPLGTGKNLQLGAGLFENGETVYYGSQTDDAIEWKIIGFNGNGVASESGNATLISSGVLGTTQFSASEGRYKDSLLHTEINNILSNRFTDNEDTVMPDRTLPGKEDREEAYALADSNYIWGTDLSGQKLWPLSTQEANTLYNLLPDIAGIGSDWWLRSRGEGDSEKDNTAAYVPVNSWPTRTGENVDNAYGVRPAFNINLSSIILTSAAIGGKDAGNTTGTLKEIADYSGSEWKLTILDSSRNGFTASAGTGATLSVTEGYNSWTVPVTCTDAPSGTKEHISAILTNSAGVALYYGHIQDSVTIPTGLSVGNYTLNVFSEQCNGDKKTDYSSPISTIELSVTSRHSHSHSYSSSVTKEPTCTETGIKKYTCSCGSSYTETISALGHAYDAGLITKPATIVSDGLKTFTCTRCGATKTEVIPKLDPTTEEEKDLAEQIETLIEDIKDETGELKVEVDVKTEKKDDGTTETVVTVGGEEVVKIITDEDGEEKIESNIWSIGGDGVYTYTGLAIKPEVQVYDGLKKLSSGSYYSVSYKNNTNAGTKAEAKVSFKGGYKGTPAIKATFTINPADLSKDATAVGMVIAANGKDQKPIPEITLISSGKNLGKGDLKYRYLNSKGEVVSGIKEVGDYTVEAKGKKDNGNFTGVATSMITVTGDKSKLLSNGKVKLTKKSYTYTGKPIIPEKGTYTLTLDGTELKEGEDYTLKVKNNVDPGKATMIFTAADENKGGYVGSINATFKIDKGKELKAAGEGSDFTYIYKENVPFSKGGAKPELIVKDEETVLTPGKDYAVSYSNNTKVTDGKDAVITVKGKGIYIGKVTLNYAVIGQDIATLSGNIVVSDKAVSKKGYKDPAVTITDMDSKKLAKDKDYALSDDYTTPDENGVITVTVIGKGNYSGSVPVSYRYLNKNAMLDNVKASKIPDKVYTGSRIRLTKKELAKLLYTGNVKNPTYLVEGKDFEVVGYSNNLKTGTAKVTLRGIGDRGGTKTVSFKIVASKKSIINVIVGAIKK